MSLGEDDEQMIADCTNRESKLSDWEKAFIDSLDNQMGKGKSVSPRQRAVLERIWEKVT